jgi:4-hydroxy-2-oxoheptanedioate aldolase
MRENALKKIWQTGGAVVNGWLTIPSPWAAEVMAHQGFDSLTIDTQHGPLGFDAAVPMLQAISTTDVVPLMRVPWNEPGMIMKCLDAGAYGIICPMVNSREECEAFVGAARYFPQGYRSMGPTRVSVYAGEGYADRSNDTVLTFAMVETEQALNNLEEIVSTPGLDGVYVGPADLAITLGAEERSDYKDPELVAILTRIADACKQHGIVAGIHCGSQEYAVTSIERGYQFVTVSSDTAFLAARAKQVVDFVKGHGTSEAKAKIY